MKNFKKVMTFTTFATTALMASTGFAAGTISQGNTTTQGTTTSQPNQTMQQPAGTQQTPTMQHRAIEPTQMDHNQDGSVSHSEHRQYNQMHNQEDRSIDRDTTHEELGQSDSTKPLQENRRVN